MKLDYWQVENTDKSLNLSCDVVFVLITTFTKTMNGKKQKRKFDNQII